MAGRWGLVLKWPVFAAAGGVTVSLILFAVVAPDTAATIFADLQDFILDQFGWLYILAVTVFLLVVLGLALSRYGALKLGPEDSVPSFPFSSWIAMLFAAGMGIGLMFYAVGEPITHFAMPPTADPGSIDAQREAMLSTFFHWGLHAWGIYAVVGLALAYFAYRYNLPLTIRSALYPLLKDRIQGPIGHAVDVFAIVGTLFGVATSLGLGVLQINAGLDHLLGVGQSIGLQVAIIVVVTGLASLSVATGLGRGVRRLSEFNLILAVALMLFVLVVGPTGQLFRDFVQNVGLYLDNVIRLSFNIFAYQPNDWIKSWTLFYWAWWISWSPFVGMFIARISRGRTVREFIFAVLFIPVGFTFFWMTVFGNTAISIDLGAAAGALSSSVVQDVAVGLFRFFEYLPLSSVTSAVAVLLVAVFFVTSADSGAVVMDTLASGGATSTPVVQRLFWTFSEGSVASVLLIAGGLSALQTAAIASALPFTIVILLICVALVVGMRADTANKPRQGDVYGTPERSWRSRLSHVLSSASAEDVNRYSERTARPALQAVIDAFRSRDVEAHLEDADDDIALRVAMSPARDFIYGLRATHTPRPAFSAAEAGSPSTRNELLTYFNDGSAGYDVMGMSADQLSADVLNQFERYKALLDTPRAALFLTSPAAERHDQA